MNVLFLHQNFPGQFKHLAPALARDEGHRVVALHVNPVQPMAGVQTVAVTQVAPSSKDVHRWVTGFESKVIRGEATYGAARQLKSEGFTPDVMIAHPGWGESLFLKDLWPSVPLGLYCEYHYNAFGADVNFDPEFGFEEEAACRLRVKNAIMDLQTLYMNAGIAPTHWQRSTFPERVRPAISVIHDGIDTQFMAPDRSVGLRLGRDGQALTLAPDDEVITFVVRSLEPYRGYHRFMRALPDIMRRRPKAQVLIIGGEGVSYGPKPRAKEGEPPRSWKQIFLDEVRDGLDLRRVHFLGRVPYHQYRAVLQLSTVHVYLTYPFVLSWSLLEAMSLGCAIVASDTAPVREALRHDETGLLVDFFDTASLANAVCGLLEDPAWRRRLGEAARSHAISNFDLQSVCLPAQKAWVRSLVS
jgi:glycosyltransferase involved in cell wall biosynthesis